MQLESNKKCCKLGRNESRFRKKEDYILRVEMERASMMQLLADGKNNMGV